MTVNAQTDLMCLVQIVLLDANYFVFICTTSAQQPLTKKWDNANMNFKSPSLKES